MKLSVTAFSYYLTFLLIILSSFSMYVEREVPNTEKIVLFIFIFISIILLFLGDIKFHLNKFHFFIFGILACAFIYSLLIGCGINYLLQLSIILSSIIPLVLIEKIEEDKLIRLGLLLIFIALIQIFFDVLSPNPNYSDLDKYTGTFFSGNDKARFLLLLLIAFFFTGKKLIKVRPFGTLVRLLLAMPMVLSVYLGFSIFAYLIFFSALFLSLIFQKFWPAMISFMTIASLVVIIIYSLDFDTKSPGVITYNWHRYFDQDHGVASVYSYGHQITKDNFYIFGTGLGTWVSRSGQFFGSNYLDNNPATMVSFGKLYESTAAPPGLSSLFIQIIEGGIFFILIMVFFIKAIFNKKSKSRFGLISFYFIFLMINYSPMFFEYQSLSYLFLSTYLIFNKIDQSSKI